MPDEKGRPYVYLAGPDVFYPDAKQRGERMKQALAMRGMAGLFPLDGDHDPAAYPHSQQFALAIGDACEEMMRKADMIVANIEPWRGPEADDGTSYEIGFMAALGKPVVLYTNDPRPFALRIADDIYGGEVYHDGAALRGKRDGMMIEGFDGFADNLMLINAGVKSAERVLGGKADPAKIVHSNFDAAVAFAWAIWERQCGRLK